MGPRIYNSLKKHGSANHTFEVIEECTVEELNIKEKYWKEYYLNQYGWEQMLFCELYDNGGGPRSEEIKQKISKSNTGTPKHTDESKQKISQFQKGRSKHTEEFIQKIKSTNTGRIVSESTRRLISEKNKGKPNLKNRKPKPEGFGKNFTGRTPKPVQQICPITNNVLGSYPSIKAASEITKVCEGNISNCCNGRLPTAGKYKWIYL
jgi:group I intron endonuclease